MLVSRRLLRVIPAVAALAALLVMAASATSAVVQRKLVYLDCCGDVIGARPAKIFLTVDAGPYLTGLRWSGWGANRATAKGTYVSTCASCAPPRRRPATVVFHKIINCTDPEGHGGHYRVYKYATLTTVPDERRGPITTTEIPTNYALCKEYQRQ